MQKQGTVVRWNAERAFGFIRSPDTDADVFFHVRDFRGGGVPREGQPVYYEEIHVAGKGPRAMAVQPVGAPTGKNTPPRPQAGSAHSAGATRTTGESKGQARAPRRQQPSSAARSGRSPAFQGLAFLLMVLWMGMLAFGAWNHRLPVWLLGGAAALNLLTFIVYYLDKSAAQSGQWRVPENNLHLLALVGGWPGAWFAQQMLRHKSSKTRFRATYWATVILNCAGLAAWVMRWISPNV
ncbi:cold shock and DUF1294 domain-containing protein [Acidovorax sp. A1169]|uniref:cold shock and DUF1294 domain-containing protein n=1 Tax=Acidovorax sp. A1169 TaxID=3059524 RepID=UPI0027378C0B|nr:cold shock and DUF1294 domain-containing protein [Acidovorax sp. A1169]MDP4074145.1 cold shock and DUF1294 domain-containing protein [Acidovorax sp. A1169]